MTVEDRDRVEKSPSGELRLTLDPDLPRISPSGGNSSDGKTERFIDLISNEQFSIRMAATKKLSSLGKKAVPALLAALQGGLWYTRECAAQALGNIGDPRAIESLICSLRDENVGVRRSAARALSGIAEKDGLSPLADAIRGADRTARRDILEAIRIASPLAGRKLDEVMGEQVEPRKRAEERTPQEESLSGDFSLRRVADGGARSLWQRLRRFLKTGR